MVVVTLPVFEKCGGEIIEQFALSVSGKHEDELIFTESLRNAAIEIV